MKLKKYSSNSNRSCVECISREYKYLQLLLPASRPPLRPDIKFPQQPGAFNSLAARERGNPGQIQNILRGARRGNYDSGLIRIRPGRNVNIINAICRPVGAPAGETLMDKACPAGIDQAAAWQPRAESGTYLARLRYAAAP